MNINLGNPRKARIDMLPLIDIVFLLLVFFIYAMLSMAVHRALPVALPVSSTAPIDKQVNLSVTVDRSGAVFVDDRAIRFGGDWDQTIEDVRAFRHWQAAQRFRLRQSKAGTSR